VTEPDIHVFCEKASLSERKGLMRIESINSRHMFFTIYYLKK